ncbi:MAG: Smr/MutS family protein [Oscillospiraceae bacterium]|jgi:DNA-nicking Smr family endonuclease|nr:Smr/MutS family protein [Oscillospiraceae bacterium]
MTEYRRGSVVELDIHGETEESALHLLTHWLSRAPADVKEVHVIHGCHGGTVLRDMVRHRLKHPRIASKMVTLNPGETLLILKDR